MTEKTFVDSNVLIYAHDLDAGSKQANAAGRLRELWERRAGCLSAQVLQEFYVNVTAKIRMPLPKGIAREVLRNYGVWVESFINPGTVVRASEISEIWQISFWDSMILASAEEARAEVVLTEDLSHGQIIAGIRIENPFA